MNQLLVRYQTHGIPVADPNGGPFDVGRDNIDTGLCIMESEDDLADRFDPESYSSVQVLAELPDDQVRRLHRSLTRALDRVTNQRKLHLNWGACASPHRARCALEFLGVTLCYNFADMEGDKDEVAAQLEARGFAVSIERHHGGATLLRLSDAGPDYLPGYGHLEADGIPTICKGAR